MKTSGITPLSAARKSAAAVQFKRDGFYIVPSVIPPELLARVRTLLRVKHYQDTIQRQAAELGVHESKERQRAANRKSHRRLPAVEHRRVDRSNFARVR